MVYDMDTFEVPLYENFKNDARKLYSAPFRTPVSMPCKYDIYTHAATLQKTLAFGILMLWENSLSTWFGVR